MNQKITFRKTESKDQKLLSNWLDKPHVKEFWDNSQKQQDNLTGFLKGKKDLYYYWLGIIDQQPYSLIMTSTFGDDAPDYVAPNLSNSGKSVSLDFMIGNVQHLGKGLGSETLKAFMDFYKNKVDQEADTFLIDPSIKNSRAIHVYEKAGFKKITEFIPASGFFKGILHILMINRHYPKPSLHKALESYYPLIQNMTRFYLYDVAKYIGDLPGFEFQEDGLYPVFELKKYFEEKDRHPFIIKVGKELTGFAMINKFSTSKDVDWNMAEFYIAAKYQNKGIGTNAAMQLFDKFPGKWEVPVLPLNEGGLVFWEKVVNLYSKGHYSVEEKILDFPEPHSKIIFSFKY